MTAARVLVVVSCLLCAACTRTDVPTTAAPLPKVPAELVPTKLEQTRYDLVENTEPATASAFALDNPSALIADGRLWEIRDGQRLVGTLQVTTVKPKVDLTESKTRRAIQVGLMPGSVQRLSVRDVPVFATSSNDKIVYLWFGRTLFQVVQLKGNAVDPEGVLGDIVGFQLGTETGSTTLLSEEDLGESED